MVHYAPFARAGHFASSVWDSPKNAAHTRYIPSIASLLSLSPSFLLLSFIIDGFQMDVLKSALLPFFTCFPRRPHPAYVSTSSTTPAAFIALAIISLFVMIYIPFYCLAYAFSLVHIYYTTHYTFCQYFFEKKSKQRNGQNRHGDGALCTTRPERLSLDGYIKRYTARPTEASVS